jgi:ATP/maltotriose-dependent transcriptional regulator MalT
VSDGAWPELADPLREGHEALNRGEWRQARACFEAALAEGDDAEAIEALAMAAWWLNDAAVTIESREHAYRVYRQRGLPVAAARMAIWLAWDYLAFRGEPAVANGWLQRAHRLLDDTPVTPEHGWLAIREGEIAFLLENNVAATRTLARRAREIGHVLGENDIELSALALEGLALASDGEVAEGIRQLDEVSAAAIAGEMSQLWAVSRAGCYLVTACERVRDFDRASQWCSRLLEFAKRWQIPSLFVVCRAHYGAVLVWRGTWEQAEAELEAARRELASERPGMGYEAVVRLGELRRRQGRLDEAAALFHGIEFHPQAQLGLAAVALDRGDAEAAAELAGRFLRRLSSEHRLQRSEALELLVRALVALSDLERARATVTELLALVAGIGTDIPRAFALAAAGTVAAADGSLEEARLRFEDAAEIFQRCGTPFETARTRIELARVLSELRRDAAAAEQAEAAYETLHAMGAERDAGYASALLRDLGRGGTAKTLTALTPRELEILRFVAQGLSNPRIAEKLYLSEHTVHRHLANILSKLGLPSRAAAAAWGARAGLV